MKRNRVAKGMVLVILAACLWGVSGTFGQFLFQQRGISVEWLISVRMLVSGFILVAISMTGTYSDTLRPWKNGRDAVHLLIFGILGIMAVQYTYFMAVRYANAPTATVLQFTGPVFIAIYGLIRYRKPLKPLSGLAIAVSLLGTFLLVTHGNPGRLAVSNRALLYGIASAVSLAVYTIQPESLMKKYRPATVIGWGLLIGGVGISLVNAPWHIGGIWDVYTYGYTLFIVLFGTLIPFYAYLIGAQLIGGQKASLLVSAEPLSAAVLAVSWLGVSFQLMDYVGALLIMSTVFLLALERETVSRPPVDVQ